MVEQVIYSIHHLVPIFPVSFTTPPNVPPTLPISMYLIKIFLESYRRHFNNYFKK